MRVLELKPKEGVFAYARISPDGRSLAYASERTDPRGHGVTQTETVVDIATRRVLFTAPGIDAYWSPDGKRLIFGEPRAGVTIRHNETGEIVHGVAPANLGDYYSWGRRNGRDIILTINGNYYYLRGDSAVLPVSSVSECAGIGRGERPLISKDGKKISVFVRGNLIVRALDNCDGIVDTGIKGAKADFSWDGRLIAFHTLRANGLGYEIKIVDLQRMTVRTLPGLQGSALFPSWTRDGRLCFRYDGPDYRGFIIASDVLSIPEVPLPASVPLPARRTWEDIFPDVPRPNTPLEIVLIWAPWSAHSQVALTALQEAARDLRLAATPVGVAIAADPSSDDSDVARELVEYTVTVDRLPVTPGGLALTEARNQMPTALLFRDGLLIDRRLGAQSADELRGWPHVALRSR